MADLVVDLDGLESLTSTIRDVQSRLSDARDLVQDARASIGSATVCGALDHFQSHWRDGRKHIDNNAGTMASMLTDSIAAYQKTEDELRNSLLPGSSPQPASVGR